MRSWSLLIAGAAISLGVAAHAQAPDIRDMLRNAPILKPTDKLPDGPPSASPYSNLIEPKTRPAPTLQPPTLQPKSAPQAASGFPSQSELKVPAALQEKLDAVLATKDYLAIAKAIEQAPPIERFVWLMSSVGAGKTVFLAFPLLRELSSLTQMKGSPLGAVADQAVGIIALYVYQAHLIDGAICEDASAPGPRMLQYLTISRPIFQSLKAKPFSQKLQLIKAALQMEQKTRHLRTGDDYLCRGGMAEFQANIKQLGRDVTVGELARKYGEKSKSGFGTDVKLPPPAKKYEPKFLPPEKYEPEQAKLRSNMADVLDALLK